MKTGLYTDPSLLAAASVRLEETGHTLKGIGTQGEKSVHSLLKFLLCPDDTCHELPCGKHVADVRTEERIYEIQTGGFYPLAKKMEDYLEVSPVTVVKPLSIKPLIRWMDPETGALDEKVSRGRPKKITDILPDMYFLREYVSDPHFSLLVLLVETEEYRMKNGYGPEKKKHAGKLDKVVTCITDGILFESPEDYAILFPEKLPSPFTAQEFGAALKLRGVKVYSALRFFLETGLVCPAGKRGRSAIYERKP